jgi:EAL domain-containing protein (putative c-di-GMP-specific phosphodiesterase class I)
MHLEVTENVLWEASQSATAGLRVLRDLGIKVGLDDFGTGYSSLSYLRQFPLDFIKIDQSFMADIDSDPRGRSIVASIVAIAHALDLLVVAEGVETEGQLRVLEDLQCEFAQGFLFATAVEAGEIPPLLAAGRSALISA